MDCKYIIADHLKKNRYDGLLQKEGCSCTLDDLMPCGEGFSDCEPAYKVMCSELTEIQKEDCDGKPCDDCQGKYLMFLEK